MSELTERFDSSVALAESEVFEDCFLWPVATAESGCGASTGALLGLLGIGGGAVVFSPSLCFSPLGDSPSCSFDDESMFPDLCSEETGDCMGVVSFDGFGGLTGLFGAPPADGSDDSVAALIDYKQSI